MVKAAVLIERRHGEDLLQLARGSARIVAQPMPRSSRQHDKVAGGERSLICLAVDLEPAAARRHDMECRIAVRLDAKPPRCPHQGSAIDRAAYPHDAQKLADWIRGVELAQQFHCDSALAVPPARREPDRLAGDDAARRPYLPATLLGPICRPLQRSGYRSWTLDHCRAIEPLVRSGTSD